MIKEKVDLEGLQIDADALIEKIVGFKKWVATFKQMHEDKYGNDEEGFAVKSSEATEEEVVESNRQIMEDKVYEN